VKRIAAPLAVATAPIVVAVVRALARGWLPMGDNAYFAIRARDVLTDHHPLVGAWSSGSAAVGVDVNNLGPLQLDLLALPVRLFGFGPGTAIGVAVVNLAAVAMVVLLLERRLGLLGAWLGACLAGAMVWTLGSELLFEPRQHHALVLPFLAFLVGAWAVASGDRWALVPTVVVASLIAQTHLTFLVPAAIVGGAALIGTVAGNRTGPWRHPLLAAAAVAAACWLQPIVEELQSGPGNISAVAEAARADSESYGTGAGLRAAAEVLAPPAGWWRSSFRAFDPARSLPSTGAAVAILVTAAVALGAVGVAARQRRDRPVVAWVTLAGVAVAGAVLAAGASPVSGPFGAVSGNFRFLWPISAFVTFGLVAGVIRLLPDRVADRAPWALGAVAVAMAVAALPTSYQSPGPEADAPLIPVARELFDEVQAADVEGPVVVDRRGMFFAEPYTYVVVAALQADGVELVFDARTDLLRFGDDRARSGPVAGTVTFVSGDPALDDRAGETLLARASLLDEGERTELARLEAEPSPSDDEAQRLDDLRDLSDRGTVAVWLER
jgi:hypothetical protein